MTKKVLITGKNSYVGNQLAEWLAIEPEKYEVIKESLRNQKWKKIDFSIFDVVVHVAGIAHIKETEENKKLYYKVNRDLAYEVAEKSKLDGVKQFVFLSSMSVYGLDSGIINANTPLKPNNAYGKSKVEAEKLINTLIDESFTVAILRPPMIYGKGCRGNYPRLANLAIKTPIFPKVNNRRSMIYIDNLSEFVRQLIDNCSAGIFFPQNEEYVNTSEMVRLIAKTHGKKILMPKLFNPMLKMLNVSTVNKVFGDLVYEMSMSDSVKLISFSETIKKTENN